MIRSVACAPLVRASVATVLGTTMLLGPVRGWAAEGPEEELAEIQVTGSRIQRSDFNTANPVTTIGAEELERLGINNISDAITQTLSPCPAADSRRSSIISNMSTRMRARASLCAKTGSSPSIPSSAPIPKPAARRCSSATSRAASSI